MKRDYGIYNPNWRNAANKAQNAANNDVVICPCGCGKSEFRCKLDKQIEQYRQAAEIERDQAWLLDESSAAVHKVTNCDLLGGVRFEEATADMEDYLDLRATQEGALGR